MLAIVIPLALLAAFGYALSDFLEQRAAQRNGSDAGSRDSTHWTERAVLTRLVVAVRSAGQTLRRLAHDRVWFAGWAVGTLAYLVQGAALHFGSVAVVQALQVTTLLFALPLSSIGRPLRPGWRAWTGGAAVCAGLVLFLLARGRVPTAADVHRGRLILVLALMLAGVTVLTVLAALHSGQARAVMLACAAGASFASNATMVKLTADDLTRRGVGDTATDWPGYALLVVTVLGVVLQQLAFAAGRLPVGVTAMVVANPVAGAAIAIVGFDERLPATVRGLVGIGMAGALVAAGVALLAHSRLLVDQAGAPGSDRLAGDRDAS